MEWDNALPFPLRISVLGAKVDVACAAASRACDRKAILNYIAGTPHGENSEPPESHPNYDRINSNVRRRFVYMAMVFASLDDDL